MGQTEQAVTLPPRETHPFLLAHHFPSRDLSSTDPGQSSSQEIEAALSFWPQFPLLYLGGRSGSQPPMASSGPPPPRQPHPELPAPHLTALFVSRAGCGKTCKTTFMAVCLSPTSAYGFPAYLGQGRQVSSGKWALPAELSPALGAWHPAGTQAASLRQCR